MITIVPTPIGNLKDITQRAVETLQTVDSIICEDTRRTAILLNHYKINKPLLVLNDFNETDKISDLIVMLKAGSNIALVSDAGTPLISDPGYKLIRECLKSGIEVDSLPGPSVILPALNLSGLPPDKFMFLGYPPDKPGNRQKLWNQIKKVSEVTQVTFILFLSPYKISRTLQEIQDLLGDIEIVLAKELTKIHQKVESKNISTWLEYFKKTNPKGEFVLLFNLNAS